MGEGDPQNAKLIYLSEKPGPDEVAARPMRPFVGGAGRTLNRQLSKAGIRRSSLFITNQVKCLCPGNREPSPSEIECCRWILDSELQRCRADTVILSGAVAFREHIGDYSTLSPDYHPSSSINERAGCVEQRHGRKWIGTLHPAHIMRFQGTPAADEAIAHLRKGFSLAGVDIPLPNIITDPSHDDVARHMEAAQAQRIFADDCESLKIGRDVFEEMEDEDKFSDDSWWMDMCGFSAVPYEAIVLPRARLTEWSSVWANPRLLQAEHNGESDRFHLAQIAPQRNIRFDTMLAHHMLHNNVYKYLKPQCVSYYTNLPYYNRDIEAAVGRKFYCGMDNIATLLIAYEQMRRMKSDVYVDVHGLEGPPGGRFPGRLFDLYFGRAFKGEPAMGKILPLLEEQREVGWRIDKRKAIVIWKFLQWRRKELQGKIRDLIGANFNWRSYGPGGDVQSLFYGKWRLPVQYKLHKETRTRRVTCDKEARKHLKEWIDASPYRKEQYAEAAEYFGLVEDVARTANLGDYISRIGDDGRVHPMGKAHGADTYRLVTVPNGQNWPVWSVGRGTKWENFLPGMRSLVLPDTDDDLLFVSDFDQVEMWTYAVQFNVQYLLGIYNSGDYLYGAVYDDLDFKDKEGNKIYFFNEGAPRTKRNKSPRVPVWTLWEAKAVVLGLLYKLSGENLAARQGWPTEKGVKYYNWWFGKNPQILDAHKWIEYEMEQNGELRPPPGMKLHYPQPKLQGINCFGQTPAAILLWTTMILIDGELRKTGLKALGCRVVLHVHDSWAINVAGGKSHPERVVQVHDIVHRIATRPIPWMKNFRYRISAEVCERWDWNVLTNKPGGEEYDDWKERAWMPVSKSTTS